MNIGQASKASGVSAKMIRHYEEIGLIPRVGRGSSGYRNYQDADVQVLNFVRRARAAGFGTSEIKQLLALWRNRSRPAREVHRLAAAHLEDLNARIAELQAIAATLSHLIAHCHGDDRPECPILDDLAAPASGGPPVRSYPAGRRVPPRRPR
jgi:Cu(I)-responsive transcriptional regulator